MTSGLSLSVVRAGPEHRKVVHPCGSQRGSRQYAPLWWADGVGQAVPSRFADAADLAGVLRELVVTAWRHQVAAAERAGNAEKVFNYVMTGNLSQRFARLTGLAASLLQDLDQDKRALERRWKRTEVRIREILDIHDAIGDDLMEVIGADAELPAAFRAELAAAETDDELPPPLGGPALALEPWSRRRVQRWPTRCPTRTVLTWTGLSLVAVTSVSMTPAEVAITRRARGLILDGGRIAGRRLGPEMATRRDAAGHGSFRSRIRACEEGVQR